MKHTHEDVGRRHEVRLGSDRSFGVVFAVVFAVIGLWPPLFSATGPRLWALGIAVAFLLVAFLAPAVLAPLNRLWFRFGLLLHRVVSPVILGFLFFATVTPVALLMRLAGKDQLGLRFDREAKSYWIRRQPPGPARDSMKNQF